MIRRKAAITVLACMASALTFTSLGCGGGDSGPKCTSENPLDVAGTYDLSATGIDDSTCPSDITTAIEDNIGNIEGTDTFTQDGSAVTLEPGVVGCVDEQGNVEADIKPQSDSANGCKVSVSGTFNADLAETPSHGQITAPVEVSSGCNLGFSSCTVIVGLNIIKTGSSQLVARELDGAALAAVQDAVRAAMNTQ